MASLASIFPVVQWCVGRLVGEELHKLIDCRRHPHSFLFFKEPIKCMLPIMPFLCYSLILLFFALPAVQVRLVNGSSDREGRVEVFYNGEWGTVCDDYFDIRDANVICRMMDFPGAVSAEIGGRFGAGNSTQRVLLDDLWCSGNENSVASCSFRAWGSHDCSHTEDAGVVCQERLPGKEDG